MNPIQFSAKCRSMMVYANQIEQSAMSQLSIIGNHPAFRNSDIRIMPDVHAGAGSVVGFTATLSEPIMLIPNVIGVDIGCGVLSFKLRNPIRSWKKLDELIRERVPFGHSVHQNTRHPMISRALKMLQIGNNFFSLLQPICKYTNQNEEYVLKSLGTLGGGNHFIEVEGDDEEQWITVHSGSRNFGLKIANYYQNLAVQRVGKMGGLEYLEIQKEQTYDAISYRMDMEFAQEYAKLNRYLVLLSLEENPEEIRESVHNYIDFGHGIIRKGAISAQEGEKVLIPLNMRDGIIHGIGLGNKEWNYSAPHGAGRKLARGEAKRKLDLDKFKREMKDVWSSCVSEKTIDESPMAYKDSSDIVKWLDQTISIQKVLKPLYNFKA